MNPIALIAFLISATALLTVPTKWAPAALLGGCLYMTLGQGIEIGSIHLPIYRMMLLVGLIRVFTRGEFLVGGLNTIDKMMILWGAWFIFAGFFHDPKKYGPIYACGCVFNTTLIYFLIRAWCTDLEEVQKVIAIIALLLVPIAIEMITEKITGKNLFSFLGGVPEYSLIREGKLRAQGPFLHPILAGTVGATCIPLFVGLLEKNRKIALIGIFTGLVMVFASASSGPVMSLLAGSGALILWRYKQHLSNARIAGVVLYFVLMMVMAQPPYYLIARIDISGGSTGWHRAFLIDQTFKHLSEWWLFGTDITRHWMPMQGIANDPDNTDITNYYIGFGVGGGIASMGLVIAMLGVAFRWVGRIIDAWLDTKADQAFMIWCFGCSLFSHAVTSISVAYFDQSMLFFWLTVSVISSTYAIVRMSPLAVLSSDTEENGGNEVFEDLTAERNAEWRRRLREQLEAEGRKMTRPI